MLLPDQPALTVTELNQRIRMILEGTFQGIWVKGEISNFRRQSSGHCYFSLKDAESQISAVLFRADAMRQPVAPRDGLQVVVYGEISFYEARGSCQLIARVVTEDGAGRLQQELERLKHRLAAEGLFDKERKRPIPPVPLVVGMITSPTGAAVQDFIRILKRRDWRGRLIVLPARVQGVEAPGELVAMVELAQRMGCFDLLVIGRGGGNIEDLWAFNDEKLARAIAACKVPVISAVGHEIDFTLADLVADVRAETPSGAAELIASAFRECNERFLSATEAFWEIAARMLADLSQRMENLAAQLRLLSPARRLEHCGLRIDELTSRLEGRVNDRLSAARHTLVEARLRLRERSPDARLRVVREQVMALDCRLDRAAANRREAWRELLRQIERQLDSLSPQAVLRRGFVILHDSAGRVIGRRDQVVVGKELTARFADGEAQIIPVDPRK